MNLPIWLEIVCGLLLLYGIVSGWRNGLIKEICSTAGFLVGCLLAFYYLPELQWDWKLILLVFILFPIVLGYLASFVSKVLNSIIIVGTINKLLGAVVGCLKYGILILSILCLITIINE